MYHTGCSARLLFLDEAQKRYSDLINVVATGLWPVRVGIVFTQEDGPQGRGYSSVYCGILFESLSLWAGKMLPVPTAMAVLHCTDS